MKTLQILMNGSKVEHAMDRTEEHFRPMVKYVKRYFDEEDYPNLMVLVVEYPDEVSRDTFDGFIYFSKGNIETSDADIWREWWIRQLWLGHNVDWLVLDYNNAMKWKH